jgi:hypothetical protein
MTTASQLTATTGTSSGSFSRSRGRRGDARSSGHTSSSRNTSGNDTAIGFDMSAAAKTTKRSASRRAPGRWANDAYAKRASIQKSALSVSLRSATHATDSTWRGCSANAPATKALRPRAFVHRVSHTSSSTVFATCSARSVAWCRPARRPKSCASSWCDSHTRGVQLPPSPVVKAHCTFAHVRPSFTSGVYVTKSS